MLYCCSASRPAARLGSARLGLHATLLATLLLYRELCLRIGYAQVLGAGFDGLKIDNCGDDDGSGCAARLARAASAQSRHSYDARVFAQWGACSFVSRVKHLNESGRAILIENSNQAHAAAAAAAPSINSAALHSWPRP